MANSWQEISAKYPKFTYESYKYELIDTDLHLTFACSIPDLATFAPKVVIKNVPTERFVTIPKPVLDNMVFHIGLIESLSYWKATCAKEFVIACGALSEAQLFFWQEVLTQGMGEYAYLNKIDLSYLANVAFISGGNNETSIYQDTLTNRALVPIGGGKDSAVVCEMIKQSEIEQRGIVVNPTPASKGIAEMAEHTDPVTINRQIDPELLRLNKEGYLNGHTPFSAYLAIMSVLCAVLFDYSDIVLANEKSANSGNVMYQGAEINHQYSKTFAFESLFHNYAKQNIASNVNYFSMLRPVNELEIAKIFSQFPQYFSIFRSCNVGQKTNSWCGTCAKCLFVYTMLYPFLGRDTMVSIFGHDLYNDEVMIPVIKELLGLTATKPFDCVGTVQEVRAALYLSLQLQVETQPLLLFFKKDVMPGLPNMRKDTEQVLTEWDTENLLPDIYKEIVKNYVA